MDSTRLDATSRSPMPVVSSIAAGQQPSNDDIEAVIQMATSARPSPDGRTGPPRDTRTQLFVGNLPYRVRWQDLKDLFRQAGTVLRADVSLGPDNRSRGYGTVLLATAEDAGRAVDKFNGYSWQTRILEVRPDRLPPDFENPTPAPSVNYPLPDLDSLSIYDRPTSSNGGGKNLFVGNLPFHCQWQDLKDLFRQAGTIIRADVAMGQDGRSRGFGTVVFATDYDADRAVKMFNGYEYNGRALKVHYDKFSASGTTPASPSIAAYSSPYVGQGGNSHPGHITLPSGYHLDFSAPNSPYDIYPPQLQMSMPHPHHTQSHIHQPIALKESIRPPLMNPQRSTSSTTSSADSRKPSNGSTSISNASSTTTPPSEGAPTSPSQSHSHQTHPHHPGPISIPPPPPVASFAMHHNPHQMSPALVSPMYHPMSPMYHGQMPMTPHGLPPITPSMPPFTFLPSFGAPLKTSESDMSINGYHHLHYPMTSSSLAQTLPMTPTPPSPTAENPLEAAGAHASTSQTGGWQTRQQQQPKKASPTRRQAPQVPYPLQAPHLTPFSPGVAMSPGGPFWGRNPYMNAAPGAPVHPYQGSPHMYPMPSPGMYPIPSPGGFTLHPQPSPGGFFYSTGVAAEPKGYFDSVMSMASLPSNGYFGGVESEILREKKTEVFGEEKREVEEKKKKKGEGPVIVEDVFFANTAGPSRTHSMSNGDKRPVIMRGSDSDPARVLSKSGEQSPAEA